LFRGWAQCLSAVRCMAQQERGFDSQGALVGLQVGIAGVPEELTGKIEHSLSSGAECGPSPIISVYGGRRDIHAHDRMPPTKSRVHVFLLQGVPVLREFETCLPTQCTYICTYHRAYAMYYGMRLRRDC